MLLWVYWFCYNNKCLFCLNWWHFRALFAYRKDILIHDEKGCIVILRIWLQLALITQSIAGQSWSHWVKIKCMLVFIQWQTTYCALLAKGNLLYCCKIPQQREAVKEIKEGRKAFAVKSCWADLYSLVFEIRPVRSCRQPSLPAWLNGCSLWEPQVWAKTRKLLSEWTRKGQGAGDFSAGSINKPNSWKAEFLSFNDLLQQPSDCYWNCHLCFKTAI